MQRLSLSRAAHYWALLAGIVAIAVVARVLHFHLAVGSDDQKWIIAAREFLERSPSTLGPEVYARALWIWAVAGWGMIWGMSLESAAVLTFIVSAMTVVLIAASSRILFGETASIFAALVYATHPLAVIYDVHILPDNLGGALLAASILFFSLFLKKSHIKFLVGAGFTVGLSYSAKSYFILALFPMIVVVIAHGKGISDRARGVTFLLLGSLVGLAMYPLLGIVAGVEPQGLGSAVSSYANLVASAEYSGTRAVVVTLLERVNPTITLYFGYGVFGGLLFLWGSAFLLARFRERSEYQLLLGLVLVFLAFLSLTPVRLNPLTFVEIQDRYLTVLLAPLSIAAGHVLATTLQALGKSQATFALSAVLIVFFAYNVAVPNYKLDRYRLLEFAGLERALVQAQSLGVQRFIVPSHYRTLVPDSFRDRGPRLEYLDFSSVPENLLVELSGESLSAFYVPRRPHRQLQREVRIEETGTLNEFGDAGHLIDKLNAVGVTRIEIRVPYTSVTVWAERLGLETRGQLVGALLVVRRS